MAQRTPVTIEDGFSVPTKREQRNDSKPTSSDIQPGITARPTIETISPIDFDNIIDAGPDNEPSRENRTGTGTGTGTETTTETGSNETYRRKPGRPKGSTTGQKAQSHLTDGLESLLVGLHFMGAKLIDESLELSEADARKLAEALRNVQRHYPYAIDPKRLAVAELAMVAAGIYVPMAAKIIKRKPPKIVEVRPSNVTPIRADTPKVDPKMSEPMAEPKASPKPSGPPPLTNPSQLWEGETIESFSL